MNNIEIYTKPLCPFCHRAKALLDKKGVAYREIDVSANPDALAEMIERSKRRTVPQVFINEQHIGGSDDLQDAQRNGLLDELLMQPESVSA